MGGQEQLKGKILRVGSLGAIANEDIYDLIRALGQGLNHFLLGSVAKDKIQNALAVAKTIFAKTPL